MTPSAFPAGAGVTVEQNGLVVDQYGNPMVPTGEQYTMTEVPQETPAPVTENGGWNLSNAFGLFNIVAGLMIVAAFLLFFGGLSGYLSRLGLEGRSQGLTYMYRGTTILFVLILILAIVNFVQFHTALVLTLVAVAVVGFGAWAAIQASRAPAEEEH